MTVVTIVSGSFWENQIPQRRTPPIMPVGGRQSRCFLDGVVCLPVFTTRLGEWPCRARDRPTTELGVRLSQMHTKQIPVFIYAHDSTIGGDGTNLSSASDALAGTFRAAAGAALKTARSKPARTFTRPPVSAGVRTIDFAFTGAIPPAPTPESQELLFASKFRVSRSREF